MTDYIESPPPGEYKFDENEGTFLSRLLDLFIIESNGRLQLSFEAFYVFLMQANGTLVMRMLERATEFYRYQNHVLSPYFLEPQKTKNHRPGDRIKRLVTLFSKINEKSNPDILKTRYKW